MFELLSELLPYLKKFLSLIVQKHTRNRNDFKGIKQGKKTDALLKLTS